MAALNLLARLENCKRALIAAALIAAGAPLSRADNNAPAPIATDRPAVTDSSAVTGLGNLVVENGLAFTTVQGQREFDAVETLLRLGVAPKTEIRITVPDFFDDWTGAGFGDMAIGVKQQVGPIHGFDVALVLSVSLPTGQRTFSSHGYDPSVQMPWSRSLSANWTAAGMLSVYWPTQNGRRNTIGESTFLIDRQLSKPWDAFVEYAGDFASMGGPRHLLHLGTAYKVASNQQLDLHVGIGLSRATVDHFVGIGYSFRVGAFHR